MKYKFSCDKCTIGAINGHLSHEQGCHGIAVYQSEGQRYKYNKWRVWSLDVWGNAREGFEVNDRCERGRVMIAVDATDAQIIKALKRAGMLNKHCKFKSVSIDGDDRVIYVNARRSDEPLYQLEAM